MKGKIDVQRSWDIPRVLLLLLLSILLYRMRSVVEQAREIAEEKIDKHSCFVKPELKKHIDQIYNRIKAKLLKQFGRGILWNQWKEF